MLNSAGGVGVANDERGMVFMAGVEVWEDAGLLEPGTVGFTSVAATPGDATVWRRNIVSCSPGFLGGDGEL